MTNVPPFEQGSLLITKMASSDTPDESVHIHLKYKQYIVHFVERLILYHDTGYNHN